MTGRTRRRIGPRSPLGKPGAARIAWTIASGRQEPRDDREQDRLADAKGGHQAEGQERAPMAPRLSIARSKP